MRTGILEISDLGFEIDRSHFYYEASYIKFIGLLLRRSVQRHISTQMT